MLFSKFKLVKGFVFDVDGVLSDGGILVMENGDQLRTFSTKDGYAIQLAVKRGYPIAIITGGQSSGVKKRLEWLGIRDVFIGVSDKKQVLDEWLDKNELTLTDILYMGDDIPDFENMSRVGLAACPADAVEEIKEVSAYISPKNGGQGAVRDVIEKVMKLQGAWSTDGTVASR